MAAHVEGENIHKSGVGGLTSAFLKISSVVGLEDLTEKLIDETKKNIDPETGLEVIDLKEVKHHGAMEDGWVVIYDKVYEVTEYLRSGSHPGGEEEIMKYLGHDATMAFRGSGHGKETLSMLAKYVVGILPSRERLGYYSDMLIC